MTYESIIVRLSPIFYSIYHPFHSLETAAAKKTDKNNAADFFYYHDGWYHGIPAYARTY
jgi:hypothetical protein